MADGRLNTACRSVRLSENSENTGHWGPPFVYEPTSNATTRFAPTGHKRGQVHMPHSWWLPNHVPAGPTGRPFHEPRGRRRRIVGPLGRKTAWSGEPFPARWAGLGERLARWAGGWFAVRGPTVRTKSRLRPTKPAWRGRGPLCPPAGQALGDARTDGQRTNLDRLSPRSSVPSSCFTLSASGRREAPSSGLRPPSPPGVEKDPMQASARPMHGCS